jgi:hypothetical protein
MRFVVARFATAVTLLLKRALSFGYYFSRNMPPPAEEHKDPPAFPFH